MENLSKIVSLFAGILVVIIIFVVLSGRLNLKNRFPWMSGKTSKVVLTPTVTPIPENVTIFKTLPDKEKNAGEKDKDLQFTKGAGSVKEIPASGAPTLILSFAFSALVGGLYLRQKK